MKQLWLRNWICSVILSSPLQFQLCSFLLSEDSDGITGKFISALWDSWEEKAFQNKLRQDKDFATLRRIDEKFFKKIE